MIEFLTITIFMILAAISPGPDFALVSKNSLCYSRKAGCYTSLGISFGILFHASYCVLGLGFIIAKSVWLFAIIKYMGATYLIYLGVKAMLAKRETTLEIGSHLAKCMTNTQAFRQGFLCNALNPKAILFFLALFTMIATPSTSIWLQIFYGLEVSQYILFGLVAYLLH